MRINKVEILNKHCYTELVYQRINKKLGATFSKKECEVLIKKVLKGTELGCYIKKGKNFYITNSQYNIRITMNSNTFRIITVDNLSKANSTHY